jgi:hypothetical protein
MGDAFVFLLPSHGSCTEIQYDKQRRKGVKIIVKKIAGIIMAFAIIAVFGLSGCQQRGEQQGGQQPAPGSAPTSTPTTTP